MRAGSTPIKSAITRSARSRGYVSACRNCWPGTSRWRASSDNDRPRLRTFALMSSGCQSFTVPLSMQLYDAKTSIQAQLMMSNRFDEMY